MAFDIHSYFVNGISKNKDLSNNVLLNNFDSIDLMDDVVKKLDKTSSLLNVVGYTIGIVNSDDREIELTDYRHKNKLTNKDKAIDKLTYNTDDTKMYKLSILVEVSPHKLYSIDERKRKEIQDANNAYINHVSHIYNTIDRPNAIYREGESNSVVEFNMWVPHIEYSYCVIRDNLYYIPFTRIQYMHKMGDDKVRVQRLSTSGRDLRKNKKGKNNSSKVVYYYVAIVNDEVVVEVFNKSYNLYNLYRQFDISTKHLDELAKKYNVVENSKNNYSEEHITMVDFDKNIDEAIDVLLGEKDITSFKYYRYGSIIHAICSEILDIFIMNLPNANGKADNRYYHATEKKIEDMKIKIEKASHPDKKFLSVLKTKTKQGELKNSVNENMSIFPLKINIQEPIEKIFLEEYMEQQDPLGVAQTERVLETQSMPLFIDPKYID